MLLPSPPEILRSMLYNDLPQARSEGDRGESYYSRSVSVALMTKGGTQQNAYKSLRYCHA